MTAFDTLPDSIQHKAVVLRLAGWQFDMNGINGSITATSPDGIPYLYDQGYAAKAISDAMTMHLRSYGSEDHAD